MAKNALHQPPKYRRQRQRNGPDRAFVELNGERVYLGRYGSRASRQEYHRVLAEATANGGRLPVAPDQLTVAELSAHYLDFAQGYYRRPDGRETNTHRARSAVRPLVRLYGSRPAVEIGPRALRTVRETWIEAGLARKYVNDLTAQVKRMFKWAASHELLPASIFQALQTVEGLRRGRSRAKEPRPVTSVAEATVNATLRHATPTLAAMVRLQWLTGMRPGELVIMRGCDLDMSGRCWIYRPETHKTAHFGYSREIPIGPRGQTILKPFLQRDLNAYLFSPSESDQQRRDAEHRARKTPLCCGNRPGTNRQRHPRRKPGDRYDTNSYSQAVRYACERVYPAPERLSDAETKAWHAEHRWTPNQLRHSAGTRVRDEFGLDASQAVLGHAQARVTEIYSALNTAKAVEVALRIG